MLNGGCDALRPCVDLPGNFSCTTCPPGYTNSGSFSCADVNECQSAPCMVSFNALPTATNVVSDLVVSFLRCSQYGASCIDSLNGFVCVCSQGYYGSRCETTFDSCASSPCQNAGVCSNLVNSYNCSCTTGFFGLNCQSTFDSCASGPCQQGGLCTNAANGFTCNCGSSWTGALCQTGSSFFRVLLVPFVGPYCVDSAFDVLGSDLDLLLCI